jgi:hypothetical protein
MRVHQQSGHEEPVGIVIADGGRVTPATRFSAFVWGPVPDEDLRDVMLEVTTAVAERSSALAVA